MSKGCHEYLKYLWNDICSYNDKQILKNNVFIYYDNHNKKLYLLYQEYPKHNQYPYIVDDSLKINFFDLHQISTLEQLLKLNLDISNFNKILFLTNLLETLEIKEKKLIAYHFTDIIYFNNTYSYTNKHNVSFLEDFSKTLSFDGFKFLLTNLPALTISINKPSFQKIYNIIDKNFNTEQRNELLLAIILKNKNSISAYKKQHVILQNFLLNVFKDNSEESIKQLTIYGEHFPFFFYCINKELGQNYIESNKNKECIFIEINAEKMIAHNKIASWRIKEYKNALDIFFKQFINFYKEINSFNIFIDKEDNKDYLCLSLFKNDTKGINKESLISIIYKYFNDLKKLNLFLSIDNQTKFSTTWIQHYYLESTLPIKGGKGKVQKI